MSLVNAPCEVCGGKVGHRGHRCATRMCKGTSIRAQRILDAGVDANGVTIHGDSNGEPDDGHFVNALHYSINTASIRR